MPTELEELVGFIPHINPQIRQAAVEHLVPYSTTQPAIFKADKLQPVKNLKILIHDHPKISEHAVTILVNLSGDRDILENLATDERFLDRIFGRITLPSESNANLLSMLLANLAKWDGLKALVTRKQPAPPELQSDDLLLNQLVDLFVKGSDGSFNKAANYDYLAYLFADLAKHAEVRRFFVTRQAYDDAFPITKLKVFTEHKSDIRRRGVASTIKNVAFEVSAHPDFLAEDEINILPYLLLPITGNEEYDDEESMVMLPDLQLLPPDKQRDTDKSIIQTHVETLLLLTTTRQGRELMRSVGVYPVIRETHARVDDSDVQDACDRLVQVLMRDEAPGDGKAKELDDEDRIVEVSDDDDDDDEDGKMVEV